MAKQVWNKGFSREADSDGLARVKIVEDFLVTQPPAILKRLNHSGRFMSEPIFRAVRKWPGDSKLKAIQNLNSRNWIIFGLWSIEAARFAISYKDRKKDFNSSPEAQKAASMVVERTDIFNETHPEGMAWCTDWNPETGTPEYWLDMIKSRIEVIKANPVGPTGFEG